MKYNKDIAETITEMIIKGCFAKDAAASVGIAESTYYKWLKEKSEFSEAIKKAEGIRKTSLIQEIRMDKSWQSKAWMLERLYRDEFAAQNVHELNQRLDEIEEKIAEAIARKGNSSSERIYENHFSKT